MADNNRTKPNPTAQSVTLPFLLAMLCVTLSCRQTTAPATPTAPSSNDHLELMGGHSLDITVPYLSSGAYTVTADSVNEEGGRVNVFSARAIGFQVSRYSIEGHADGKVRLTFRSAETTLDGKSKFEKQKPALPFALPRGSNYARLIYFVRSSRSDHNMAIVAAKGLADVNAFTTRLIAEPGVCGKADQVFCVWVPLGIALRQH